MQQDYAVYLLMTGGLAAKIAAAEGSLRTPTDELHDALKTPVSRPSPPGRWRRGDRGRAMPRRRRAGKTAAARTALARRCLAGAGGGGRGGDRDVGQIPWSLARCWRSPISPATPTASPRRRRGFPGPMGSPARSGIRTSSATARTSRWRVIRKRGNRSRHSICSVPSSVSSRRSSCSTTRPPPARNRWPTCSAPRPWPVASSGSPPAPMN